MSSSQSNNVFFLENLIRCIPRIYVKTMYRVRQQGHVYTDMKTHQPVSSCLWWSETACTLVSRVAAANVRSFGDIFIYDYPSLPPQDSGLLVETVGFKRSKGSTLWETRIWLILAKWSALQFCDSNLILKIILKQTHIIYNGPLENISCFGLNVCLGHYLQYDFYYLNILSHYMAITQFFNQSPMLDISIFPVLTLISSFAMNVHAAVLLRGWSSVVECVIHEVWVLSPSHGVILDKSLNISKLQFLHL